STRPSRTKTPAIRSSAPASFTRRCRPSPTRSALSARTTCRPGPSGVSCRRSSLADRTATTTPESSCAWPSACRASPASVAPLRRQLLQKQGFPAIAAEPSDLIVAVDAAEQQQAEAALGRIDAHLAQRPAATATTDGTPPRSLTEALLHKPHANLLVLSTPG